ncbi:MAG: hypothetical protein EZS28_037803, partial [Streblomastix strix]
QHIEKRIKQKNIPELKLVIDQKNSITGQASNYTPSRLKQGKTSIDSSNSRSIKDIGEQYHQMLEGLHVQSSTELTPLSSPPSFMQSQIFSGDPTSSQITIYYPSKDIKENNDDKSIQERYPATPNSVKFRNIKMRPNWMYKFESGVQLDDNDRREFEKIQIDDKVNIQSNAERDQNEAVDE